MYNKENQLPYSSFVRIQELQWKSSDSNVVDIVENDFIINGTGHVILTVQGHDEIENSIELYVINKNRIMGTIVIGILGFGCVGGVVYKKKHK